MCWDAVRIPESVMLLIVGRWMMAVGGSMGVRVEAWR